MEILFLDNHLIAVEKPAGMTTQSPPSGALSLEEEVKKHLKALLSKPGNVFLEPVHRLDAPVSGVVLFARTSKALSRLQRQMRERRIRKIYWALVESPPSKSEDVLEHYLIHGDHRAEVVSAHHPQAKKALLRYRVLFSEKNHSFLEISLETGRYHQIRAQLGAIGCPILGDYKYGSKKAWIHASIALHHYAMELEHPVGRQTLLIQTKKPWFLIS